MTAATAGGRPPRPPSRQQQLLDERRRQLANTLLWEAIFQCDPVNGRARLMAWREDDPEPIVQPDRKES